METFQSMTSVAGEMMIQVKKVKTKKQARKIKIMKQVRKVKSRTAKVEMKRENILSLAQGLVRHRTDVQETTIQILGKCVFKAL
jgi:hypothetical protein